MADEKIEGAVIATNKISGKEEILATYVGNTSAKFTTDSGATVEFDIINRGPKPITEKIAKKIEAIEFHLPKGVNLFKITRGNK